MADLRRSVPGARRRVARPLPGRFREGLDSAAAAGQSLEPRRPDTTRLPDVTSSARQRRGDPPLSERAVRGWPLPEPQPAFTQPAAAAAAPASILCRPVRSTAGAPSRPPVLPDSAEVIINEGSPSDRGEPLGASLSGLLLKRINSIETLVSMTSGPPAGIGERNIGKGAQAHVATLAIELVPKDPRSRPSLTLAARARHRHRGSLGR